MLGVAEPLQRISVDVVCVVKAGSDRPRERSGAQLLAVYQVATS